MELVGRLADHVVSTRFEDLTEGAVRAAKIFVLDTIGVSIAGAASPYADEIRAAVQRWGGGEEATAIGSFMRLPAPSAALVGAFQAHNQEFDCIHDAAVVHPLTTALPAALAVAERRGGVGGRDLILAVALGVDAATTIGAASRSRMSFFRPATAGIFGVAAAVGKLEGLGRAAMMDAFGLAYSQAAGTMQAHVEGKPTLAFSMGVAARAGIQAVDLAAAGFPGPHDVLEGPFGYFRLMEGAWDAEPGFAELGRAWRIAQLSHKPFPSGRATHGGLDGLLRLQARHGFVAGDVERATLLAPPLIHQLVGRPCRPAMSAAYARLCFSFAAALALSAGTVDIADFRPERFGEPALRELAGRIAVEVDANPDPNALAPQMVRVRLRSGAEHAIAVEHALGSPANPLDRERRLAKFRRCWSYGHPEADAGGAERLVAMIDGLEEIEDVAALVRATTPG
jgi:aconitate decarboxylase